MWEVVRFKAGVQEGRQARDRRSTAAEVRGRMPEKAGRSERRKCKSTGEDSWVEQSAV